MCVCGDVLCELGPTELPLWTSVSAPLSLVAWTQSVVSKMDLKRELKSWGELLKTQTLGLHRS